MEDKRWSIGRMVGVWAIVVIGVAVACSQIDTPSISRRSSRVHAAANEVHGPAYNALTSAQRARLESLKVKLAWGGQIHNRIMQDLITQKEALRHASAADRCQAVLNAVWARVPEMRAQAPTSISDEQLRAFLIQRVAADKHCQGVTTANVLAANFVLAPVASAFRQTTDTVTDAGIALAQSVADAAAGSSGFPDDVAAATDEVLASASGLSDADLSVGVAEAGIAVSSSSGWYSYGDGGGFAADSAQIYAQSLVMLQWWRVLLNPLTATDALSGAGGMYLAHIAGVDDSYTLWLTGVASAAIGSGAYLAAL